MLDPPSVQSGRDERWVDGLCKRRLPSNKARRLYTSVPEVFRELRLRIMMRLALECRTSML